MEGPGSLLQPPTALASCKRCGTRSCARQRHPSKILADPEECFFDFFDDLGHGSISLLTFTEHLLQARKRVPGKLLRVSQPHLIK